MTHSERTNDLRPSAIILLGPTGSGKTPLGQRLESQGFRGHPCRHFDFGANLREIVDRDEPDEQSSAADIAFLRGVLHSGALLEDAHFPLAARILTRFIVRHAAHPGIWLVLNGLPRHAGQAAALEPLVRVEVVLQLVCSAETIAERIRTNAGGDRTGRQDDSPEAIARKLAIYHERTMPLVEYYVGSGVSIETIAVRA